MRYTKYWLNAAQLNRAGLMNAILTGSTAETFKPDHRLIQQCGGRWEPLRLLDFGCGLGRNVPGYSVQWSVTLYDSLPMLMRAVTYLREQNLAIWPMMTNNWDALKTQKFDAVLASLVFQHILEPDLIEYLKDLRHMTKRLVVFGRRFNDGGGNTWEIVNRYWEPVESFVIEGDPHGHDTVVFRPRSIFDYESFRRLLSWLGLNTSM